MKQTTKSSQNKEINPVDFWNEVFEPENKIEQDAQMLMFRFLSEIEKFTDLKGFSRKELAKRIGTSASYLTQVWRGDKPLNFQTVAKLQEVLNISFKISGESNVIEIEIEDEVLWHEKIRKYHTNDEGYWCFKRKGENSEKLEPDFYSIAPVVEEEKNQTNETKGIAA
jgi:transcriptional regulator with XRE-family HTH domain